MREKFKRQKKTVQKTGKELEGHDGMGAEGREIFRK